MTRDSSGREGSKNSTIEKRYQLDQQLSQKSAVLPLNYSPVVRDGSVERPIQRPWNAASSMTNCGGFQALVQVVSKPWSKSRAKPWSKSRAKPWSKCQALV